MQAAAGPSNPANAQAMLSTFMRALQEQHVFQQEALQALKEQQDLQREQIEYDRRREVQQSSAARTAEQTSRQALLSVAAVNRSLSQTQCGGSSYRTCSFYKRNVALCKAPKGYKNAPEGRFISMLSINEARDRIEELEHIPVFVEADSQLGYRLNPRSALDDHVICKYCKPDDEFAIPVSSTNAKHCCVICKDIAGANTISWNPPRVLCGKCQHKPTEASLKEVLPRMVGGLNRVVSTYDCSLTMELEFKVADRYSLDVVLYVRRKGELVAVVALEIDGNEHSSESQYGNEFERNAAVIKGLQHKFRNTKILFVRFNPNKDVSVKVDKSSRSESLRIPILERLLVLQSWLMAVTLDRALFPDMGMLYLFYSHDSKRLWRSEEEGVKVCVTHRAVCPGGVGARGAVWWRYLTDPLVPSQLRKHYGGERNPFEVDRCEELTEGGLFQILPAGRC
jgi:hypothetical protein